MAFCSRCKRTSHYRSQCRAKTFKGGQRKIGGSYGVKKNYSNYQSKQSYGRRYNSYKKKRY